MGHTDGYASMVELFDIRAVYAVSSSIDQALLEKRYGNVKASIQRMPRLELECQPVMMSPAQSIQVFGAMPGKLRLEVTYTNAVLSISYSGAYAIHWTTPPPATFQMERPLTLTLSEALDLKEKVAELHHVQWSNWTKHLFGKCLVNPSGALIITTPDVDRWKKQLATPYKDLSEGEQEWNRKEATKFLRIFSQFVAPDA